MKLHKLLFLFITTILVSGNTLAQRITLGELQVFCSNKNWETTNKTLLAQKWDYYNSKEGDDEHYNVITWSYGRNYYDDSKASGWIYLENYDGLPNKIMYRFRQREYYTAIQSQLKTFAYVLTDESIFDERVTTTYENKQFILKIAYNREEDSSTDDDYDYYENSNNYKKTYTVYEVSIFKKGGVYDPNNGFKKEYDEDGNLQYEFFLKNGKIEGKAKSYFVNGKISTEYNFKNSLKEGINFDFYYFEDSDDVIKVVSNFKNGKKNGREISYFENANEKYIIGINNYKNDILEGKSFQAKGKNIKEKYYSNGALNGNYKEYVDLKTFLLGGIAKIDTLALPKTLILEQNYVNDKLNGAVKEYDLTGSLTTEGFYSDSLKTGTWKFYYDVVMDEKDIKLEHSGKLYRVSEYANDKLNGKTEIYSFINEVKIPCEKQDEEDCFKTEIIYWNEKSNYANDEYHGPYELKDENGLIINKGIYLNGKENGEWIKTTFSDFMIYDENEKTYEKGIYFNGTRQGEWKRYNQSQNIVESYTFLDDNIHGKHTTYRYNGKPFINKYFDKGRFYKYEMFNQLEEVNFIVEIKSINYNKIKVIETNINLDSKEIINYEIVMNDQDFKVHNIIFPIQYGKLEPTDKVKNGFYDLYNQQGQPLSQGEYDNNRKASKWVDYYYDQQVKVSTYFDYYGNIKSDEYYDLKKNEPFSGEFIYKDNENNVTQERKIKDGLRHGTTRYKDQNDKTIKKESYKEGILKE